MKHFESLSAEELALLEDAPALITILVGGADGELDREERTWSERLIRSRTYNKPSELNEFYMHVAEQFWAKMNSFMNELPQSVAERSAILEDRLKKVNPILAKLSPEIAYQLYKGSLALAQETAKSSGGFLRIGAVNNMEKNWMELPMIKPIPQPENWNPEQDDWSENEEMM